MTDYLDTPFDGSLTPPVSLPECVARIRFGTASVKKAREGDNFLTINHPMTVVRIVDGDAGDYDPEEADTEWYAAKLRDRKAAYEYQEMLKRLGVTGKYPSWLAAARALEGKEALVSVRKRPNDQNPDRPWTDFLNFQPVA